MDYTEAEKLLASHGQEHLLKYFGELGEVGKQNLLSDIAHIDFGVLENLKRQKNVTRGKITPIQAVSLKEIAQNREFYKNTGVSALKSGKVGAVLLAGGQGSRLGFDKPKGMFDIGVTRTLSIFGQQFENIKQVTSLTGAYFPVFVMTSDVTHRDTVEFFAANNFFGYPKEKINFFIQDVAPACSFSGKIFLKEKDRVALMPNGNGGWYTSLKRSGLYEIIGREGIEWLNVYSVDNVLQRVCDPIFIGATIAGGYNSASKVVKKVNAEEKVGVLCNEDGKPAIIEYYEMPDELRYKEENGELVYCYGVILNYLFKVSALNATLSGKLPYHCAEKAIEHIEDGVKVKPTAPCGIKFETLVVDMVKMMGNCLAFEVEREREFAPVKNAVGADSVDTARKLLEYNGVKL